VQSGPSTKAELKRHALNLLGRPEALQLLGDRNPDFQGLTSWEEFISVNKNFGATFLDRRPPDFLVAPVEPFYTTERITIQQGLFLCASSLAYTFETTLGIMHFNARARTEWLYKFEIEPDVRIGILTELDRINITEATLFPGLDGFARSLRTSAEIPGRAPAGMARFLGDHSARPNH
jgi:hypothetical protein